jgi:hypothetical protein
LIRKVHAGDQETDQRRAVLDLKLLGFNYSGYYATINFIGKAVTILFGYWVGMLIRSEKARERVAYKIAANAKRPAHDLRIC